MSGAIGAVLLCALALCALALCALVGCAGETTAERSLTVDAEPLTRTMLLTGEIRTGEAVELLAPNLGMWPVPIDFLVDDGTTLRQGDVVAEFDSANLLDGLEAARDTVAQREADLESARARTEVEVEQARFEVESREIALEKARIAASVPPELKSQREMETLRLELRRAELEATNARTKLSDQLEKADADVGIAEVELEKARADVRRREEALEVAVLRAPFDAAVEVTFNDEEGRAFEPGDNIQPGQPVARFPNYASLRAEAFLFDVDQGAVAVGGPVRVILDAYPERVFTGRVRDLQEVAQQASRRSARRTFRVVVELDDVDRTIMRSGMSVRVEVDSRITEWLGEPTLVAPRQALEFLDGGTTLAAAPGPDPAGGADDDPGLAARIRTADGWTDVRVGRCSLTACIVRGVEAGTAVVPLDGTVPGPVAPAIDGPADGTTAITDLAVSRSAN